MSKAGCEVNNEGGLVPLPSLHAVEACRLRGFQPDGDVGKFVIVAALEDVAISVEPRDRRSFSVPEPESPQLRIRKEACFDDCKQALAPFPRFCRDRDLALRSPGLPEKKRTASGLD